MTYVIITDSIHFRVESKQPLSRGQLKAIIRRRQPRFRQADVYNLEHKLLFTILN